MVQVNKNKNLVSITASRITCVTKNQHQENQDKGELQYIVTIKKSITIFENDIDVKDLQLFLI